MCHLITMIFQLIEWFIPKQLATLLYHITFTCCCLSKNKFGSEIEIEIHMYIRKFRMWFEFPLKIYQNLLLTSWSFFFKISICIRRNIKMSGIQLRLPTIHGFRDFYWKCFKIENTLNMPSSYVGHKSPWQLGWVLFTTISSFLKWIPP